MIIKKLIYGGGLARSHAPWQWHSHKKNAKKTYSPVPTRWRWNATLTRQHYELNTQHQRVETCCHAGRE